MSVSISVPALGHCYYESDGDANSDAGSDLSETKTTLLDSSSAGDAAQQLRLLSYNIHGWRDSDHVDNLARVTELLRDTNADVVCLQEVLHPFKPPADPTAAAEYLERVKVNRGFNWQAEVEPCDSADTYLMKLSKAAGYPYVSWGVAHGIDNYFGAPFGNAILSRYPIVAEARLNLTPDAKFQQGRRLAAENRQLTTVKVDLPSGPQSFTVLHLDQLNDELRLEQLHEMLLFAEQFGPQILCGDFNSFARADCDDVQWQRIVDDATSKGWPAPPETTRTRDEMERRGYKDLFYCVDSAAEHPCDLSPVPKAVFDRVTPGATCWVKNPLIRIDYIYMSESMRPSCSVLKYGRIIDDASDHFGVYVDLLLASTAPASVGGSRRSSLGLADI